MTSERITIDPSGRIVRLVLAWKDKICWAALWIDGELIMMMPASYSEPATTADGGFSPTSWSAISGTWTSEGRALS